MPTLLTITRLEGVDGSLVAVASADASVVASKEVRAASAASNARTREGDLIPHLTGSDVSDQGKSRSAINLNVRNDSKPYE